MNSLFALFEPAPSLPEIQDQERIRKEYKYWRFRILYGILFGYAFYYFTRKSFTFAMPGMIQDLGFEKTDLGILGSILYITYGFSKFVSGVVADKTSPRYLMAAGLVITGLLNIFFGMSSSLLFFAIFWGLNGWFQGFGWAPCTRFLTQWYSHSERGSWWSICNISHNVGGFMIPWIVGIASQYFGWRYAMFVPGVLCILMGIALVYTLRDTPQSLGLPAIGKFRNDQADLIEAGPKEGKKASARQLLMDYVLKNPYIWMLAIAYFFIYVIRTGANDWTALYLVETKGYSRIGANGCVSCFDVGGFFGNLAAGWSSDRLFRAKRGPVNFLFALGAAFAVFVFWIIPEGYPILDSSMMFLIGFMIFGPQMLIGLAAAELSHKSASATAVGFVGIFAYMGAAFAGYPLAAITHAMGWDGFFIAMIISGVISIILLLPLWSVTAQSIKAKQKKVLVPDVAEVATS